MQTRQSRPGSRRYGSMSIRAMAWAREQKTGSPGAKLVLMVLAEFADEAGYAYPSQATIAEVSEQGVSTVRRHLDAMEGVFIVRHERRRKDGTRTSDGFQLLYAAPASAEERDEQPPKMSGRSTAQNERTNRSNRAQQPLKMSRPVPTVLEPSGEPPVEPSGSSSSSLRSEAGRGPIVEKSRSRQQPTERATETEGQLMALCRARLYVDGQPPPGYDDGRDMNIIRELLRLPGMTHQRVADAIEGLAKLRERRVLMTREGETIRHIGAAEPVTMRLLHNKRFGVQPLFQVAEDTHRETYGTASVGELRLAVARCLGIHSLSELVRRVA